ncbi:hypothetical protein BGC_62780 [Burkholderia sp. 3C]
MPETAVTTHDFQAPSGESDPLKIFRIMKREFLGYDGAPMGSTLLGAFGGEGTDTPGVAGACATSPDSAVMTAGSIWMPNDWAIHHIASLNGIAPSFLPCRRLSGRGLWRAALLQGRPDQRRYRRECAGPDRARNVNGIPS